MRDPYSVLGISPDSTDDQVKKAYRDLAKKYHPDVSTEANASEKMQEINEAYDRIMKMRESGTSGSYSEQGSYGGYSYSSDAFNLYRAQMLISMGRYAEAKIVLESVPTTSRDGEWYYTYGLLHNKMGEYFEARAKFEEALRRDPSNPVYRAALGRVGNSGAYRTTGTGSSDCCGGCSECDLCTGLMCADCLCECMGSDLIRCC